MKAEDFGTAVNRLSELLIENMPKINEGLALDAAAMVKDRILNEGEKANGASLGGYSTNELPPFFFLGKALNQGGDKLIKQREKQHKGISYKEWREANNRPTDHVTLSFSGTTLKDIGVSKQVSDGTKVVTTVGPKNTVVRKNGDTTEKITDEYLGPRYGNFMEPNVKELNILKNSLVNSVNKLIANAFH